MLDIETLFYTLSESREIKKWDRNTDSSPLPFFRVIIEKMLDIETSFYTLSESRENKK
jgi:hypothetical protein